MRRHRRPFPRPSPTRPPEEDPSPDPVQSTAAERHPILDAHRQWLESGGRSGRRAEAVGAALAGGDCRGAVLAQADLSEADLRGADLSGADLTGARFEGADLSGSNLEGADLTRAILLRSKLQNCRLLGVRGLAKADLRNVDLSGATGLNGTEFANADLTGARLPDGLSFEGRLAYVATSSQNARPTSLSILVSCVFLILTVFSTPDSALLSNASLAVLPNLATNIPATSFFWVAPVLLLSIFIYLHLQMLGIGDALAELPAVLPEGTPLEQRAYPWIGTRLLRLHGSWSEIRFEEAVIILLLWGTVPLTLMVIWMRYLPLRDWVMSGFHVILIIAAIWGAVRLFEQTAAKICGEGLRIRQSHGLLCAMTIGLAAATVAGGLFPIVLDVNPRKIPRLLIDVRQADLSQARLERQDLRYAAGREATLNGAILRDANLSKADFQRASFRGADLEGANLLGTDLDLADFRNACLRKATLKDADLEDADFRGAYLGRADLRSPLLKRANFANASLHGVELRNADLTRANFEGAVMQCFIYNRDEPTPSIECPRLDGANLSQARFPGADLRFATGLTQAQLSEACGDAATRLPGGLTIPTCGERPFYLDVDDAPPSFENPCLHEIRDDPVP
jgi:uncharacterized protein YjbI with pentapeptide repeats